MISQIILKVNDSTLSTKWTKNRKSYVAMQVNDITNHIEGERQYLINQMKGKGHIQNL